MHPYEKLFAALRDKRSGWIVGCHGYLRRNLSSEQHHSCPIVGGAGMPGSYNGAAVYIGRTSFAMSRPQASFVIKAADNIKQSDLRRKLIHYLGAQ